MNCPNCHEELGLNDICINPACSYFGSIIKSSEKSNLNDCEHNLNNNNLNNNNLNNDHTLNDNNNYNNKSNPYNTNTNPIFNNKRTNRHDSSINSYDNNQSTNRTNDNSFNISKEEFAAFIGTHNTNYYLDCTDKMKNNNNFLSWNWACFFLGPYWLLYRKLYAVTAIFIVVNISFSLLIPGFFSLIIRIVLTMFANAIYLNHSVRKIRTVKTIIANLSTTQYINRLRKNGGVNLIAPFILVAIYIVVIIIIVAVYLFSHTNTPYNFSSPSYQY